MRIVCIDDEFLSLSLIQRQLEKIEGIEVVGAFTNPLEGKEFILNTEIDAAFLDIEMTPINGLHLAEEILEELPDLNISFVTAYDSFAVNAFEINAIDYLLKPVKSERVLKTVERIREELKEKKKQKSELPASLHIKLAPFLAFEEKPGVVDALQWRTSKSKELFIYLLQNNGVIIEKSAIIDLLWSEYELDKAYSLLYTTIYNIRKQLVPFNEQITLHNHSYGYLLELKNVAVDLFDWEHALDELTRLDETSVDTYEMVMRDYPGPYLSDCDFVWLEPERQRYEKKRISAINQLADFYLKQGKRPKAIDWYNVLVEDYPTLEEAHFQLMKLYEASGDFGMMMQQYSTLTKICRDYYQAKPSPHIVDWYIAKVS